MERGPAGPPRVMNTERAPGMVQLHRQARIRYLLIAVLPFVAACGSSLKTQALKLTPTPTAATRLAAKTTPAQSAPTVDPILALIAASNGHFQAGQRELEEGHFDAAKLEFDRAVDMLLESPYGARSEPRIRDHFDRLVDRISAYEVKALAEGDGFTEKKYEAASIDQLLAETTTVDAPPPASSELTETVQSDLETSVHDIPIPLNQRVLSYIELFQGRLRDFIQEGLTRGGKYLPMIQNVFRAEGLPLDLAYVPLVESAFKPNALSRAKAKGVWQFMAGTAVENGLRRDWYIDERSDPEKATQAAAKYLSTLSKMFDGDWHLALASYNGGPGRLQRAMKQAKADDFWKLAAKPRLLPRETREYVPMILAAIVIARNPAQYGFDFAPETALAYEKVTLSRPVDLRHIAEWAETTIDEIQALNPELRRWTTPVRDTQYELKVPAGTAAQVNARLAEASASELASLNWYTAKRGDTLALIAKKLKVSGSDLAEANYLSSRARISIGQKLMVPREATVLMAARTTVAEAPVATPVKVIYSVKPGDTLASIARLFNTTVAAIQTWNPTIPGDRIAAGQRLTLYRITS